MIAIVDVCSGNLRSVERALAQVGAEVCVTRDPEVVRRADKIVVPGQGAFPMFMRGLAERGLGEALREAIASGRPYLGICLGLQILFEHSEEHGEAHREAHGEALGDPHGATPRTCAGLGVVRGPVVRLVPGAPALKVPHMGWNQLAHHRPEPLFAGVAADARVYFVHSFHAVPADRSVLVATAEHGIEITAAIRQDNVFACQFHPEKSQTVGLRILTNFVEAP